MPRVRQASPGYLGALAGLMAHSGACSELTEYPALAYLAYQADFLASLDYLAEWLENREERELMAEWLESLEKWGFQGLRAYPDLLGLEWAQPEQGSQREA